MASVIINDPIERTKLSRARSIGCILCYILLLNLTTERVKQPKVKGEKFNYGKILKSVLKNRPMIGVMIATVGSLLWITGNSQLGSYLYKEYYHAPQVMTFVSLLSIPMMILCFPLIPKLSGKFGKKNVILFSAGYNLMISLVLFLVPIPNVYVYLVLSTLATSGQTAFTMLIWALVTDCIDYHEYITGERSDGSLYSIYTFSRKIGSTLASTIASFSLGIIGYVSGIESQSIEVAANIRSLCTAIPVITCILELIGIGLIFNLNKEKTAQMYEALKAKREAQEK